MKTDLYQLLKMFKEHDFLTVKKDAVQHLCNSGRMDPDAAAVSWVIATVDRLKMMQDRLEGQLASKVPNTDDGDPFDPW